MSQSLHVVMYHYIRDLPASPFPRIKGMLSSVFRQQVKGLQSRYEIATLESALAFLRGTYIPQRDLCLLTFDDGLKEHYTEVTPILSESGIRGIFFPITWCLEEVRVASVHMNHFLMAALDFEFYQQAFLKKLKEADPDSEVSSHIDQAIAQRTYRWDTPSVATFKYLFNFVLNSDLRNEVVRALFEEHIGDECSFSRRLYLNWEEARQMQAEGMLFGGHSHRHQPLAGLSEEDLISDLTMCRQLLGEHLKPQSLWPFSYPYGKRESFCDAAIKHLERLGFTCSFTTELGANLSGTDVFALRRLDCKDAPLN
jgi:peptidoglycan/xylan/chitin deacetylase (PgdA/CDA1 family)